MVPTTRRPRVVLDDVPEAVTHFWHGVATVPPGVAVLAGPASLSLLLARLVPWTWTGRVLPGRAVLAVRR